METKWTEEAILRSIEGGYERKNGSFSLPMKLNDEFDIWEYDYNAILSDPLFWQALYKEYIPGLPFKISDRHLPQWKSERYRFIDHIAEGKDAESFFESLLAKK